eukprot:CAMPEP_0113532520 /NCGR_PEP_ID=MMETSP0015_2-20120614/4105_1 /TAXON_ID=2838 /ORGANISM="Odontella" /LENGTH=322 /DNA_ID=CAMNT_0000431491 /DNA_START=143 /DNA_END=1111 /DNA_ORIENTATION=+ /assembly_acc=CAM_ASM_000160
MAQKRCIFDTDAGIDDVMALCYLLSNPCVDLEAITIAYGVAHGRPGAINMAKVVSLAERADIPVFIGREKPLGGGGLPFLDQWRKVSDELPNVDLPVSFRHPESEPAADFLKRRLCDVSRGDVSVLATGGMTNVAQVLQDCGASSLRALDEIVIMGGAFDVPGNVFSCMGFVSLTKKSEWNLFVDPLAARQVLTSGARILVVPLDATNMVPLDDDFISAFPLPEQSTPLGKLVGQVVRCADGAGVRYAWDPLAAVAMLERHVVEIENHPVSVEIDSADAGTTRRSKEGNSISVAYAADATAFRRCFIDVFFAIHTTKTSMNS